MMVNRHSSILFDGFMFLDVDFSCIVPFCVSRSTIFATPPPPSFFPVRTRSVPVFVTGILKGCVFGSKDEGGATGGTKTIGQYW